MYTNIKIISMLNVNNLIHQTKKAKEFVGIILFFVTLVGKILYILKSNKIDNL